MDGHAHVAAAPSRSSARRRRPTEEQVFAADKMEGIALRYGFFYG